MLVFNSSPQRHSNVVNAIKCREECKGQGVRETKTSAKQAHDPLNKRPNSSIYLYLHDMAKSSLCVQKRQVVFKRTEDYLSVKFSRGGGL